MNCIKKDCPNTATHGNFLVPLCEQHIKGIYPKHGAIIPELNLGGLHE